MSKDKAGKISKPPPLKSRHAAEIRGYLNVAEAELAAANLLALFLRCKTGNDGKRRETMDS